MFYCYTLSLSRYDKAGSIEVAACDEIWDKNYVQCLSVFITSVTSLKKGD